MTEPTGCLRDQSRFTCLRRFCLVLVALVLAAGGMGAAWCQNVAAAPGHKPGSGAGNEKPYALIFGTVWGPDHRPLYGVKVKIRRASDKKAKWELYSDHRGEFAQRLPAGKDDYVVWADVKGLKLSDGKKLQPGQEVAVHIENDERTDIGLHLTW